MGVKYIINKFKDGAIIASEWSESVDGPWPFGDVDEYVVENNYNFFRDE